MSTAKLQRDKANHALRTPDWAKDDDELESRNDGGCWSTRLPYTASWVLSPALQTGKGTRENVLQALVRGIWGLGLWLGGGALF